MPLSRFCFRDQSSADFLALADAVWSAYVGELREHAPHARLGFVTYAAFDAGLRLLVDAGRSRTAEDPRVADTHDRLEALVPLLAESEELLREHHDVTLR